MKSSDQWRSHKLQRRTCKCKNDFSIFFFCFLTPAESILIIIIKASSYLVCFKNFKFLAYCGLVKNQKKSIYTVSDQFCILKKRFFQISSVYLKKVVYVTVENPSKILILCSNNPEKPRYLMGI